MSRLLAGLAFVFFSRLHLATALKCSDCKLTFAPVIHTTTRTPFYNECLGRCQLGDEEVFEPVRSTVGDGEQAQADPITQLLPLPVNAAALTKVAPSLAAVTRFQKEGFVYIGRPGFGPTDGPQEHVAPSSLPAKTDNTPADIVYRLRIAYDTGDAYIKTVHRTDVLAMMAAAESDPALAAKAEPLVPAGMPVDDGEWGAIDDGDFVPTTNSTNATSPSPSSANGNGNGTDTITSLILPGGRRSLQQSYSRCPNCNGICVCISGKDDRKQATALRYPLTAVSELTFSDPSGGRYACSGTVVGSDAKAVVTAAHCVYDSGRRAFMTNFVVTPGRGLGNGNPYGTLRAVYAEAKAEWKAGGNFGNLVNWDTAILGLNAANPGGSMGIKSDCGSRKYRLITAGYPGDKPDGTMWRHIVPLTMNMCDNTPAKVFGFDVASGQSGSGFWNREKGGKFNVRLTISFSSTPGNNGAVAITQSSYAMIVDFMNQYNLGDAGSSTRGL